MPSNTTPLFGGAFLLAAMIAGAAHAETDLDAGRKIFTEGTEPTCSICHTMADAEATGEIGPSLDELKPTADQVRTAVTSGIGVMPAFAEMMSKEDIETVALYVAEVTGGTTETGGTDATAEESVGTDKAEPSSEAATE
ncbi:cytochrome c [uncultured Paracoccus sp.]|uniref:SorU family sulfite dehydrogenase c-type cytochrome subunit n=1 Tax=uncultured Paracoccus sp. TaxID=189685 RepID=UPI00262247B6|nr:cytochrome c [uncultured Paracoccus sp.]